MSAIYPPKPGRGTRCGPARPCAGAACEAVWLLGGASTAHAEPPARLPCLNCGTAALYSASFRCEETQTTLRGHPCCDAHGRLRDALRREAPERGRWPAIAICPTQPFPTGLQAPGARRWPRLPVPPSHTSHSKKPLLSARIPPPDRQFKRQGRGLTESKGKRQCGSESLLKVKVKSGKGRWSLLNVQ